VGSSPTRPTLPDMNPICCAVYCAGSSACCLVQFRSLPIVSFHCSGIGWTLWQDPVIGGQKGKRQLLRRVAKERHDRPGTQHHHLVENGPFCVQLVEMKPLKPPLRIQLPASLSERRWCVHACLPSSLAWSVPIGTTARVQSETQISFSRSSRILISQTCEVRPTCSGVAIAVKTPSRSERR
jgi:hypothetical protein